MITVTSYLGIGSNLGDRRANIEKSIELLKSISRISIKKISLSYETPASGGPKNQPKFLNAAAKIQTTLTPLDLLVELKNIESSLKRKHSVHWGPRTIDLDILFYDDLVFLNSSLSIPHPLLHKRVFVLRPLADIAPDLVHPQYKRRVKDLLEGFKNNEAFVPFNKG